jgi:hypothetical protein
MDAHGERHGKDALGRMDEQADSLHECPMMYSGLVFDSDC